MTGIDEVIATLDWQYDDLAAVRSDGLSADEAQDIIAFAEENSEGLIHATVQDLRALAERLNVRRVVFRDQDGGIALS